MSLTFPRWCSRWLLGAALMTLGAQAYATVYTFTQGGFSGGGMISGSFEATNLVDDNAIRSTAGEVSNFHMTFTGDAVFADFSFNSASLGMMVYFIGAKTIGDHENDGSDGMAAGYDTKHLYASGMGPLQRFGGIVFDPTTGAQSITDELIHISAVPEPASYALLLGGLALVAAVARRRARQTDTAAPVA